MATTGILAKVKKNLILEGTQDDELLNSYINAAVTYAESYQHLTVGYYTENTMPATTEQAVVILVTFFYESRDGSTGGFFNDHVGASDKTWEAVNTLLRLDRVWMV